MKDNSNKKESINNDYLSDDHKINSNSDYFDNNSIKNQTLINDLDENFLEVKKYKKNELIEETHLEPTLLYQEPAYAEICSFFNMFSSLLNIKPISFIKLEKIFCTYYNGEVDIELIDLHIMLMRKIYLKFARADKFENALDKFCSLCPALESETLQLQRYSYSNLPLSIRLSILKALCESQFDCNVKFKENIFNTYQTNELRLAPIGYDKNGFAYYFQQDYDLNIRVYTEEPDDLSGGTWALVAKSENDLLFLIDGLRSSDFGKTQNNDEEDIDEEQLLNNSLKLKNTKNELKYTTDDSDKFIPTVELTEFELNSFSNSNKRFTFIDIYHNGNALNKKKIAKEERKKEKEIKSTICFDSNKFENEVEDEEKEEKFLNDEKRILPRRSARNNAINNIKAFTLQKRNISLKIDTAFTTKLKKKSDLLNNSEESNISAEFVSSEENEEEYNSSDDEFTLGGSKITNSLTNNTLKKKKKKRTRKQAVLSTLNNKKLKQSEINVIYESSDEEEPEEVLKERKKATEKTLCMECKSSKRPDLLLLCDMCDDAWHTWCLKPQLWYVPDGDWFCPNCHHIMLLRNLSTVLIKLREALKIKESEKKKKQAAADRLKKEMDFIGISLNNIIPPNIPEKNSEESFSSSEDDGQRKSKKRALKKVLGKISHKKIEENYYGPIVTIAEGRSRRTLTKVDYNFHAYDEQLQEAMSTIDSAAKIKEDETTCGLGRGKDMANIIEAEKNRKYSQDNNFLEDSEELKNLSNFSLKKRKKSQKKLTDLNLDNITESSESDEYHESNDEVQSEEPEPSEDEYLPKEFRRIKSSKKQSIITKSDEDFIDDDESEYENLSFRRKKFNKNKKKKNKSIGKKKKISDSEEETSEEFQNSDFCSDTSDDNKKKKKSFVKSGSKWGPKASTSESDEEELEIFEDLSSDEKTETGRPLRKAAIEVKKKIKSIEDELKNDNDEDFDEVQINNISPIISLSRPKQSIISDDEPEFEPDDEEEESSEDEILEKDKFFNEKKHLESSKNNSSSKIKLFDSDNLSKTLDDGFSLKSNTKEPIYASTKLIKENQLNSSISQNIVESSSTLEQKNQNIFKKNLPSSLIELKKTLTTQSQPINIVHLPNIQAQSIVQHIQSSQSHSLSNSYTPSTHAQYYTLSSQSDKVHASAQNLFSQNAHLDYTQQEYISQYTQPQFVYQTLNSYQLAQSSHQQMMVDPRTGQLIESDSLGHVLADAMNPEDL